MVPQKMAGHYTPRILCLEPVHILYALLVLLQKGDILRCRVVTRWSVLSRWTECSLHWRKAGKGCRVCQNGRRIRRNVLFIVGSFSPRAAGGHRSCELSAEFGGMVRENSG